METYEYCWASSNYNEGKNIMEVANELGAEGWKFVALDEDGDFIMERVVKQEEEIKPLLGRCGNSGPLLETPGGQISHQVFCALPAGHKGWHKEGDTEWWLNDAEPPEEKLYYDEETLVKVRRVLENVGSIQYTGTDIISMLQNEGIVFRERAK